MDEGRAAEAAPQTSSDVPPETRSDAPRAGAVAGDEPGNRPLAPQLSEWARVLGWIGGLLMGIGLLFRFMPYVELVFVAGMAALLVAAVRWLMKDMER
jgi:hypothetical protein